MGIGFGIGSNSTTFNQNTVKDETDVSNQVGTTQTNQTQTGQTSTVGTQSGSVAGSTEGVSASTQIGTTTGSQAQTGRTTTFSDAILAALESTGLGGLAAMSSGGAVDLSALEGFDPTAYVNDQTTRAQVAADRNAGIARGGLFDAIGGTSSGNTMAALLDQQLNMESDASVRGARADATAQASDIVRQNLATRMSGRGQESAIADMIMSQLKGGATNVEAEGVTMEASNQQNQATEATLANEISNLMTSSQSSTIESLIGLVSQIIAGTNVSHGTEAVSGKTKEKGMGIGIGL